MHNPEINPRYIRLMNIYTEAFSVARSLTSDYVDIRGEASIPAIRVWKAKSEDDTVTIWALEKSIISKLCMLVLRLHPQMLRMNRVNIINYLDIVMFPDELNQLDVQSIPDIETPISTFDDIYNLLTTLGIPPASTLDPIHE